MDLSLVIPAFNEEDRLRPTLDRVVGHLQSRPESFEIIVVDDGSSDGTSRVATGFADPRVRLLRLERNRGKGAAVRAGMLAARGDFRVFTDADLSTPISEMAPMLAALRGGADLCIGSRALDRRRVKLHQPWYREGMGRIFNLLVRLSGVGGISDTQCGFKGLRADAAETLFPLMTVEGFSFDVELILLARRHGFRVTEMPVEWYNSPQSRVHPLRDAAKMFTEIIRIRWRHRQR